MRITSLSLINQAFLSHYEALLGTVRPTQPLQLADLYPSSSELDLSSLDSPFTIAEVRQAVTNLATNKASGPDGLPNELFLQHWQSLQPHVMEVFHSLFLGQTDLTPLNEAAIVLVPKLDAPIAVTDFRPISLISLLPKLISKVLANRIKPHMAALVDIHQTAFVHGRYIAENFLAARESLHHVHKCSSPALLVKLDFTKAFDTLDWSFLFKVLEIRGFPRRFISWITHLLSTSTSRIRINGQLSLPFCHKRGLRQGDPISPYLFILAADVFQQMTTKLSNSLPYQLTPKLPSILTFQYADDTVLLISAVGPLIRSLRIIIHCFSASSGLLVNFSKSSYVPLSLQPHLLPLVDQLLGCSQQNLPMTYLGMPLSLKTPSREHFVPILNKLEQRLAGWKSRFISRAGKLQLVKSVLSTIPTYFMSCFLLPKWLLQKIDVIRRSFLWTRTESSVSIHLLNWQTVCLPVANGGLGVINLHLQNISLLLRWWWIIYSSERRLWQLYATKLYGRRSNPHAPLILSPKGSFFWKAILKLKPIFHSSVRCRLLSGQQTSFWFDPWAGQPLAADRLEPLPGRAISVLQAKIFSHRLLPCPLTLHHYDVLQSLAAFSPTQGADILLWNLSPSHTYSAKSIYTVLSQGGKTVWTAHHIWKAKVSPSMRLFFFFLLRNKLLTHDVMTRRRIPHVPGCVMCSNCLSESAVHLFFLCPFAVPIWNTLSTLLGYNLLHLADTPLETFLSSAPRNRDTRTSWTAHFITATFLIWRERNARIFRHTSAPAHILTTNILHEAALCLKFC